MSGKKGMKHYPVKFRDEVVKKCLEGQRRKRTAKEYGLNRTQVINCIKWYKSNGTSKQNSVKKRGRPIRKEMTLEEENRMLRMENEILKKFHELLKEETEKKQNIK